MIDWHTLGETLQPDMSSRRFGFFRDKKSLFADTNVDDTKNQAIWAQFEKENPDGYGAVRVIPQAVSTMVV
jgi:hypothetical protein